MVYHNWLIESVQTLSVPQSMVAVELPSSSVLCARCACALGKGQFPSDPQSLDFESASQVVGQASFPDWEAPGKGWLGLVYSLSVNSTRSLKTCLLAQMTGGMVALAIGHMRCK